MILSFKQQFVQKIINGTKKQTIRADPKKRWKECMSIQFWSGSPRQPKTSYLFKDGVVSSVVDIEIDFNWAESPNQMKCKISFGKYQKTVLTTKTQLSNFALADGFESFEDFKSFFKGENFEGVLIKWD
jgi:hypothetical protein